MSIEKTWKISAMDVRSATSEAKETIHTLHYRLDATDGEHSASTYATVAVELVEGTDYESFDSITEETAIGWMKAALGEETVAAAEASVESQIASAHAPESVSKAAPWA